MIMQLLYQYVSWGKANKTDSLIDSCKIIEMCSLIPSCYCWLLVHVRDTSFSLKFLLFLLWCCQRDFSFLIYLAAKGSTWSQIAWTNSITAYQDELLNVVCQIHSVKADDSMQMQSSWRYLEKRIIKKEQY